MLSGKFEIVSGKCQGNLFLPERGNPGRTWSESTLLVLLCYSFHAHVSDHHKKKQLEEEKKEREEREKQLQQQQLQDPGGGMLMAPTTPTRFVPGSRPRFSPSRVQTSPRQISPRGVHPVSLTRASPRGGGVRHEPYPGARPRKPLNFDPNRRPQPSSMRLPTDPSNSAQKPIKIEAMDEDDDNADKTQSEQPKSVDSGKGDSGGEPAATDSASPAPPHTPTDSIHSPAVRDDGDESSSSTIVNEPSEVKYSDTLPPGGLSLDSDLSNLMGAPSETAKSDTSASDSAAIDPNVSVKLEAVGDDDDLEIMGVEPGQMPQPDYGLMPNLQQQMGFGPSTSGAQGGMGDQSSQGYSKSRVTSLSLYVQSSYHTYMLVFFRDSTLLHRSFKMHCIFEIMKHLKIGWLQLVFCH